MMTDISVIAAGTACTDEYYAIDKWIPEGDKMNVSYLSSEAGGMVPNAACVLAALDIPVRFFDMMRPGHVTRMLLAQLQQYHVDTSLVTFNPSLPDAKCLIFLSDKERTVMAVNPQKPLFTPDSRLLAEFKQADYFYTTLHNFQTFAGYRNLLAQLKAADVKIVFDIENHVFTDSDRDLAENGDILFFNEYGFKCYCADQSENRCIKTLLEHGVQHITVTLGDKGCRSYSSKETVSVPAFHVQVTDPTGAGDTFNAAFLKGLIHQDTLYDTVLFASAAAALAVTKQGPRGGVIPEKEICAFIEQYQKQEVSL